MKTKRLSDMGSTAKQSIKKTMKPFKTNASLRELARVKIGRGKTVLITGASSGIGAEMSRVFARLGYNLAICARRQENLETIQEALLEQYPNIRVEVLRLDVADYEQVFKVFKQFQDMFGHIDRVIINAGVGKGGRIGTGKFEVNRYTAEINFVAGLAQCEAAMQIFRAQKNGHLVVISSVSALRGLPKYLTTYAATKAGMAHLVEGIRADMFLEELPIKVTTIYPGYIRTEMNEWAGPMPFEVDVQTGTNGIVAAIEAGVEKACIPTLPWSIIGKAIKILPLNTINKLS